MNRTFLPIQHIKRDLDTISGMLCSKESESIFVDIYSKDAIFLKKAKDYMVDTISKSKNIQYFCIKSPADLDQFIEGKSQRTETEKLQMLTSYDVFDHMSAEMLLLHRYQFILRWYKKVKWLAINPVSLFLLSRSKIILNIAALVASWLLFTTLPNNNLVVYFMGASSPLYYLIWLPYALLCIYHIKYIGRLNLLILEMDEVFDSNGQSDACMHIVFIDASVEVGTQEYRLLQHQCLENSIHVVNFTDRSDPSEYVDFTLQIPQFYEEMALKYIGVLSGLSLQEDEMQAATNTNSFTFKVVEDFVLESIETWGEKRQIAPKSCLAFVVHYEFLINRFELAETQKKELAKILVERLFSKMSYEAITHRHESENEMMSLVNQIRRYIQ